MPESSSRRDEDMKKEEFEIRDIRKKEQFVVDDIYLNGYAKLCGIFATGVYMALCRHADIYHQTCFPSISLLARKLNVSKSQVIRALQILEDWNIIRREKTEGKGNRYFLIDKKHWRPAPGQSISAGHQCQSGTSVSQTPVSTRHRCPTGTGSCQTPTGVHQTLVPVSDRHPKDSHIRIQNKGKNIYTPLPPKSEEKISEDIPYEEIISFLNLTTGSAYGHERPKTRGLIKALWKDGFRLEDFRKVIGNMAAAWGQDPKLQNYLRPETLFSSKFESYLNWKIGGDNGNHGANGRGKNEHGGPGAASGLDGKNGGSGKYSGIGEVLDCGE